MHVPIPRIQKQIVESCQVISRELFLEDRGANRGHSCSSDCEETAEVMSSSHAAAHAALTLVNEYVAPAPDVAYAIPAPVIDHVSTSPVIEHITPAPSVTHVTPSEQFSPADYMTAVATGVSLDFTGLMNPQCAITTLEEQIVATEVTQDIVSTPVCAGDTGFDTRWARECEVLRVGTWILIHCFRPDGKRVRVHRRHGWG